MTPRGIAPWLGLAAALAFTVAAAAPVVVEFHHGGLDNYFVTADPAEAAAIDHGSAGPGWSRTGGTFNAGGSEPVCRFYGSIVPGPNSHFYTVDAAECAALRQLQDRTPDSARRWNFEGLDFATTAPAAGPCPPDTVPVRRAYNNGYARGIDSNHRLTADPAGIAEVVARGWTDEGVVMCAPTAAGAATGAQFLQRIDGVWSGVRPGRTLPVVVRFDAAGGYLLGEVDTTQPGFERGSIAFDPRTGGFSALVTLDGNGAGGFSAAGTPEARPRLAFDGTALVVTAADGGVALRLERLPDDATGIVGAWAFGLADNLSVPHFVFQADGHFMALDTIGGGDLSPCGVPGIEYGSYAWEGGAGTLTVTGVVVDTDGCAGLNDSPLGTTAFQGAHATSGIALSADGATLTLAPGVVLRRVSR